MEIMAALLDWDKISQYQKLSVYFIRRRASLVNLKIASRYQELDMDFIEEFRDKLDMKSIFRYQELKDEFLIAHLEEIDGSDCDGLMLNNKLSDTVIQVIYKRWVLYFLRNICKKLGNA